MEYADSETQEKLIDACNLICRHVSSRLPEYWQVVLTIEKDEASLELLSPDGEDCFVDSVDYGISVIDDLCVTANYLDKQ